MKKLKNIMSVILCIVLLVCIANGATVAAKEVSIDRYLQINQKICNELKKGVAPEEIFENLSDAEISILKDKYDLDNNNYQQTYGFSDEVANNPEVKRIDELANKYYDYYVVQKSVPTSDLYDTITINSEKLKINNDYAGNQSEFMRDIGYKFTIQQIAAQLVSIGAYLNIGKAFPFLSLAALIVGMGLIAFTAITIAYCAVAVGANNLILTWYVNSAQNLLNARTTTAAVVAQKEQGVQYWLAFRENYGGKGGIRVGNPLTESAALGIVKADQEDPNVLAAERNLAAYLGTKASPRYGITFDKPHNAVKQPLNFPHVHANVGPGTAGKTHIFYIT